MECERVIPRDILDDLCSRFIINVPDEERRDLIRICFQIESAHWFYLDFYSKHFPTKKPCGIKEFAQQIFKHLPFLQPYTNNVEKIIDEWKDYKFCVPTFGAILLDEDLSHVLLVQSYCSRSSWGFPKGKVNKDEPPYQCAIREVYEETGFDISHLINTNEYIEANVNDQVVRLYLIPGINKQEKFEPKTRNEIKAVNWFPICDIPLNKKEATLKLGTGANTFFLVSPFLRKLRQWIYDHNHHIPTRQYRRQRHKSCSDIDYIRFKASDLNLKESVDMLRSFKDKEEDLIFTNTDSAYKEDYIKDIDKQVEIFRPNVLEQPICYELSDLLNSSIKDSFYRTCHNLEQFQQNNDYLGNVYHSDKLSKTIVVVQSNKKSVYNNFIDNIAKMEASICNITEETPVQENGSSSIKGPLKQNINILSNESAFRKVEKSGKNKKRNRGKKVLKSVKSDDVNLSYSEINVENSTKTFKSLQNEFPVVRDNNEVSEANNENSNIDDDLLTVEKDPIIDELPFISVSRWLDFKFDKDAILRSMEEVVLGHKKQL